MTDFVWGADCREDCEADSEQRSHLFAEVRLERMVARKQLANEHLSERERASSVAIVATRSRMSGERTFAQPAPKQRFHLTAP